MAPGCPEEVDVFTIPHSRMKELVQKYLDRLTSINFGNEVHLMELLETLCLTFREFIAHEQIENKFIMKKLRNRLKALSIQNTAVCNCHKDNQLIEMLNLFEDGYKCSKKSDADRVNFGLKLRQALEDFTGTFLPHMAEEEEVFQPLLMQHFSIEELKQIKATVLQQHFKIEPEIQQEKFVEDNVSSKVCSDQTDLKPKGPTIDDLSNEVILKILSFLNPKDLCRTAQVSSRLNKLAMDKTLWTHLFPVRWANGDWDAREGMSYEEVEEESIEEKLERKVVDEDADVDESDCIEDWDTEALAIQRQSFMLTSMCKHLLSIVGGSVQYCDLAYSKGLTNGTLYKILSQCPNLEYLNLAQTRISDLGFKGMDKNSFGKKLKHLDLSGCLYITDLTLQRLASAFGQVTCHGTQQGEETKADDIVVEDMIEEKIIDDISNIDSTAVESNFAKDNKNVNSMPDNGTKCEDKTMCCKKKARTLDDFINVSDAMPGSKTCQNQNKGTCCMMNLDYADGGISCVIDLDDVTCEEEVRAVMDVNSDDEKSSNKSGNMKLKKLIKCYCCGKVDEMINEMAHEEDEPEKEEDFQDRLCNHGNQDVHNHGRASTATHRDTCCQGKTIFVVKEDAVNCSYNANLCFHETSDKKGQGHVGNDDPYEKQENIIDNPQTETIVGENGLRTKNDDFPEVLDTQGQGSRTDILDPLTKDESVHGKLPVIEIEAPRSETMTNREELWTIYDSDPVLTELPTVFIMDDLDLKFGMKTCDKTNKNMVDDSTGEQNVTLTNSEVRASCPSLEYLSLSGCYQITDEGLSFLSENNGLPNLKHLDLSGCFNLTGPAISELVDTCSRLDPGNLFYCDNIVDGPYFDSASGCQNLQCSSRVCCRCGE